MKYLKFISISLFIALILNLQSSKAQQWEWVKQAGGFGKCKAYDITSDNEGNIIVAGSFTGTVVFGETKFINYGSNDLFIAKYNPNGDLLWAKQGGGTKDEEAYGVVCDKNGNVFITGYYSGYLNLDNNAMGNGIGTDYNNCFVIKYDKDGLLQWAIHSGGNGDKYGKAVTIDKDGNVFFTGVFKDEIGFLFEDHSKKHTAHEDETEEFKILKSKGASSVFVAKIEGNSDFLWVEQSDGEGMHEPSAIESDNNGNCYITGSFSGTFNFNDKKLASKGGKDIFVTKYDPAGKVIWATQAGGVKDDQSSGMSWDANGYFYLTGYFLESARFGKTKLKNKSNYNIFVSKIDYDGNTLWAKQAGGSGNEYTRGITSDNKGNIFVTGEFNTNFDFANSKISNSGDWDIFVLDFNSEGKMIKGYQAGGKGSDKGIGITSDEKNNCFVLGTISQEANFDNANIKRNGDFDIVIGKIKK